MFFIVFLILILILIVIALEVFRISRHFEGVDRAKIIGSVGFILFTTLFLSPLFVEYGTTGKVATFNDEGKIESIDNWIVFCWSNCTNYPFLPITVESSVSPITENPKVRKLKYNFEVEISDPKIFLESKGLLQLPNPTGLL